MIIREEYCTVYQTTITKFIGDVLMIVYSACCCSGFFIFTDIFKSSRQEIRPFVYKVVDKDLPAVCIEEEHAQLNVKKNDLELQ